MWINNNTEVTKLSRNNNKIKKLKIYVMNYHSYNEFKNKYRKAKGIKT